jgi:hypothetical protein
MEMMTSGWTDERMDDLKHQVDELGRRVEDGFTEQRQEFNRTQGMIIGLHATITRLSLTLVAAAIGLVATQAGLILTQL